MQWADLVDEYRVVILSEAGSGKTTEIKNRALQLKQEGKYAFFLMLEHIPNDFENAFEIGTFDGFNAWLATVDDGWLLLDSVDEARLRSPFDFHSAIRTLSGRIRTAKERAHVFVTGRTHAWRPKTDLIFCESQLPISQSVTKEIANQDEKGNKRGSVSTFKIVTLDDTIQFLVL